ncbi:hypothetical protein OK016_00435 [Vibrio chagasii]|nr:hypothetical protein [Vibrio chagasii]
MLRYLYLPRQAYRYDGNNTPSLTEIQTQKRPSERVLTPCRLPSLTVSFESISFEPETATAGESIVASALLEQKPLPISR